MTITELKTALLGLTTKVYHFVAENNANPPFIVYGEDGKSDFLADNIHSESGIEGTIDLYTRNDADTLIASIEQILNSNALQWNLNNVIYEEKNNLIHYEWVFRLYG